MVSLDNFFFFLFSSDVTKQLRWWNLWDQILVPALPCSQLLTEWIMRPLCWSDHLCALLPPWKERKLCFAADLAIWNSSHHPFLGLKLLSLKVPSHCALYRLVLEKSWQVYVLLNFYIILQLIFFGVEAYWSPLCLWELSTVCGLSVCWSFKVSFPTQSPFFDEISVRSGRCAYCSLIGLKCSLLWCGLFGDQLGKKTNSVTVLILKVDKFLFEIKNQSLPKKKRNS